MDAQKINNMTLTDAPTRPDVKIGDTVKCYMKIKENNRERSQIFKGVIIAMKGSGSSKTITVRKISFGIGVERIIPLYAPTMDKLEIVKRANPRRSKLYYLRDRVGKKALKIGKGDIAYVEEEVVNEEVETPEVKETVEEETKE